LITKGNMMTQDTYNTHSLTAISQGLTLHATAQSLVENFPQINLKEMAKALHHGRTKGKPQSNKKMAVAAVVTTDQEVEGATQLAQALMLARPNSSPEELAEAIIAPGVYPDLSAYELGEVLLAPGVFPDLTREQMQDTLLVAGYSPDDVTAAVDQLYPQEPPAISIRQIQPVWSSPTCVEQFDDTAAAQALGNIPLTGVTVRHGNIVDDIQAIYQGTALASHGGGGGGGSTITFDGPIIEVFGKYGYWFGSVYVLQVGFRTAAKIYGPFGDMAYSSNQTAFSYTANEGEQVYCFNGCVAAGDNGKLRLVGTLGVSMISGL
jgi:hypothetical protein